ncbi:hypothetical protein [Streptomyces sp. NPDC127105]
MSDDEKTPAREVITDYAQALVGWLSASQVAVDWLDSETLTL